MKKIFVRLAAKEMLVTKEHFDSINDTNPDRIPNLHIIRYEDKDGNECDEFGNPVNN